MHLTLEEVAAKLGKSERQIRYLMKQGELKGEKRGGHWFFDAETIWRRITSAARAGRAALERTIVSYRGLLTF